ncbi:MAG TPA: hypothetical protein VFV93_15920 [Thermomicrobiales bacterium]|nr:hypothetical protein [Thermomicrobiales bacterium]
MAVQRSADHDPADDIQVVEISREEGIAMFDRQARERLGLSGEEFLRKWNAGEIEDPDRNDVMMLVMMIPFTK